MVNVPVNIDAAVPLAPPVILPVTDGALQLYVVPAGTIPLVPFVGVALKAKALPVVAVIALMLALGFTVTVNENTDPTQLPEVGVTR